MGEIQKIKIFGERNTGTNLIERALLEASTVFVYPGNLPSGTLRLHAYLFRMVPARKTVERLIEKDRDRLFTRRYDYSLGWKHARTPVPPPKGEALPEGLAFITVRKNPYSWLLSLHRRPYAAHDPQQLSALPFSEFLRTPWRTAGRENARSVYDSPVDLWCDKVASYAGLDELRPTYHMRYEDFLDDPERALTTVGGTLGFDVRPQDADFDSPTKGDSGSREKYRSYYLTERWREKLTAEDVAFINARLDAELVRASGYDIVDPHSLGSAQGDRPEKAMPVGGSRR